MILKIRHRGLKRFYEDNDASGVNPEYAYKIRRILTALDEARKPQDINVQDFRLHPLKGDMDGYWSVTVRANWRIIFRFEGNNVTDVELTDYH